MVIVSEGEVVKALLRTILLRSVSMLQRTPQPLAMVIVKPSGPPVPVRRKKEDKSWKVPDQHRAWFVDSIESALMFDVTFDHQARPMSCVSGYRSTGEAIGLIMRSGSLVMPPDAVKTARIAYDRDACRFHDKDDATKQVINRCDYLLLSADGTATAGWKA